MEEIALGEMGMKEKELWEISPRSLFNKLTGFRKLERDAWERVRIQSYLLLLPHCGKGGPPQPCDLLPLPWDANIIADTKLDAAEAAKLRKELWAKIDAEKQNNAL